MLENPSPFGKYALVAYAHIGEGNKDINMKSLDFCFWELFTIDAVFFAEREMNSEFSFMKVDISEWSISGDSGVQPESELTNPYFSLVLYHIIIEFLEFWWEIRRGKDASMLDPQLEGDTMIH